MQFKGSIDDPESDNSLKSILKIISAMYESARYRNEAEDTDAEMPDMMAIDELQDIE